ncbi:hypothetical protein F7725_000076 [Dissostichus mawsoni]|uniref:Uncharacterized protein n=1 Tax=Dissostichus mawsoni TaxID=36200 RepID=A0A7J5ZF74_DISMA|nr:hypothetical protein F7725_000076 [Dissostichus mawsoni]
MYVVQEADLPAKKDAIEITEAAPVIQTPRQYPSLNEDHVPLSRRAELEKEDSVHYSQVLMCQWFPGGRSGECDRLLPLAPQEVVLELDTPVESMEVCSELGPGGWFGSGDEGGEFEENGCDVVEFSTGETIDLKVWVALRQTTLVPSAGGVGSEGERDEMVLLHGRATLLKCCVCSERLSVVWGVGEEEEREEGVRREGKRRAGQGSSPGSPQTVEHPLREGGKSREESLAGGDPPSVEGPLVMRSLKVEREERVSVCPPDPPPLDSSVSSFLAGRSAPPPVVRALTAALRRLRGGWYRMLANKKKIIPKT